MKILIICNCASGLEIFRGMLIKELIKGGNEVKAIVPLSEEEKETEAESRIEKMNCDLMHLPMERRGMNPIHDLKLVIGYYNLIRKYRPDLVITYTIKPNIYGGLAARILRVPYVVNITGLGTAFQDEGILKNLVTIMYKVAIKKAKIVFFENQENRDVIVKTGIISETKTHILAGAGVDLNQYQYKEYPQEKDVVKFLFMGRVMREKGIEELFSAMRRLRSEGYQCTLDILGGFEENYADQIEHYEAEGWLNYHGYQSDVRTFIEECHCFVLPSWHEGMANTNLESAAMGRPIITSNIHGCMEAVVVGESGLLFECKNTESLYDAMRSFLLLPYEKKRAMGIRGRKHMQQIFDKKKVVAETVRKINEAEKGC